MIVTVGEDRYALVYSGLRVRRPANAQKRPPQPVFLISASDCSLEPDEVLERIRRIHEEDDVCNEAFLSDTLLVADGCSSSEQIMLLRTELADEVVLGQKPWHLNFVYSVDTPTSESNIPSGPYFLSGEGVFHAWKIHTDASSCFETTVLPTKHRYRFKNLNSIGPNGSGKSVAVPSRLYYCPSPAKPLAGVRIGIKDNFRLAGTKSAVGNRAFLNTYDQDEETAAFIKTLIDLGAVIVGKTKMTAFASGEKPIDWFDFQCPFNPRGDTYLEPGASSTGSAAATAAYQWVDICIGTDTNGSVREPAARCGVYGIRCSTGGWGPTTGLYPCSPVFDTVGAFSRSLRDLQVFAKAALGSTTKQYKAFPTKILYPTEFFPVQQPAQQRMVESFVGILESFLGVKKTNFSLAEKWAQSPPAEAEGKSLEDYAYTSGYNPFYYDIYHEYDGFRDDHLKKFGTKAYVSPSMQWRWDRGAEIPKPEVERSHEELKVLHSWFSKEVLGADETSGSTAILILPVGPTQPDYRDVYSLPGPRLGIDALSLASFMRMPQLVVPIGQVDYDSRVSGRTESFPVASSIAGAEGSDLMLIDLTRQALEKVGFPTKVSTGRYAFDP
ncbi:amidase signature domain-containing protein [Chaetomium tenue]|uniref:Amidase signature domain-containing protein n=1 Tax=Chaetomium tenue TaxID=1854479 RepID=A0ACB7PES3_9PEZI|nr:amidase signature domain-containing protein [Chaetomium globosum]